MSAFCFNGAVSMSIPENVTNTVFGQVLTVTTPGYTGTVLYSVANLVNNDASCPMTASAFSRDTSTGKLKLGTPAIDFAKCQKGLSFNFVATRSNNALLNSTCNVKLSVTQIIKQPVITDCAPRFVIERSTVGTIFGAPLVANTTNVGTSLVWSMNNSAASPIGIGLCDGQLRVLQYFRWKDYSSFNFTVTVVNDGTALGIGSLNASCRMTVWVIQAALPPVPSVTSFFLPELSPVGTFVGNVKSVDPDGFPVTNHSWAVADSPNAFNIDSKGNITVRLLVDPSVILKSTFTYTLNVSNQYATGKYPLSISLTPIPRPPTIQDQFRSVREDVLPMTKITPA
jgi:hypothetical protein